MIEKSTSVYSQTDSQVLTFNPILKVKAIKDVKDGSYVFCKTGDICAVLVIASKSDKLQKRYMVVNSLGYVLDCAESSFEIVPEDKESQPEVAKGNE